MSELAEYVPTSSDVKQLLYDYVAHRNYLKNKSPDADPAFEPSIPRRADAGQPPNQDILVAGMRVNVRAAGALWQKSVLAVLYHIFLGEEIPPGVAPVFSFNYTDGIPRPNLADILKSAFEWDPVRFKEFGTDSNIWYSLFCDLCSPHT